MEEVFQQHRRLFFDALNAHQPRRRFSRVQFEELGDLGVGGNGQIEFGRFRHQLSPVPLVTL